MHEPATLLLIRPRAASERLLQACQQALEAEIKAIVSPILRIEPIAANKDPADYPALIISSANGARHAGALGGRLAYVVGKRTAQAVERAGGRVEHVAPDSAALVQYLLEKRPPEPLLWLRGRHVAGDIAGQLRAQGIHTDAAMVYDQVPLAPSAALLEAAKGERPAILPLYSPRSATLIGAAVEAVGPALHVISISPAVARVWQGETGAKSEVCTSPTGAEMERRIIAALRQGGA